MSAISFGLAATAILVSMFLIMALLEHLIIPRMSLLRPHAPPPVHSPELKAQTSAPAVGIDEHEGDVFVVMPGEEQPTFLARISPLPSPREGARRPADGAATVL